VSDPVVHFTLSPSNILNFERIDPVAKVFKIPELFHHVLKNVSEEVSSELFNCRLICCELKTYCDMHLDSMWIELRKNPPKGRVDITSEINEIDKFPGESSSIDKFKALARVFSDLGVQIPNRSIPTSIHDFEALQNEIDDKSLRTVWKRKLRKLILTADSTAEVPPSDASAGEIRKFLNDPAQTATLARIRSIHLKNLNLVVVPPELDQLRGLQSICLDNNRLSEIPDFSHLQNLQTLSLVNNQLTKIPDFAQLQNLQRLYLDNNRISEIPDFTHLQNLQVLNLVNNKLNKIPDFANLPNLQELYLDNNCLSEVPNFTHLQNLRWLYMNDNKLNKIPDFANLPNLQRLGLNDNQLSEIPNFTGLQNLQRLGLNNNQLSEFPDFANLQNLQWLSLNNNKLAKVPDLTRLQNLLELYLNRNTLSKIPNLTHIQTLRVLSLRGNITIPAEDFLALDLKYRQRVWMG
jgi:Leucine-rich repeat (LRR) protein